MGNKNVGALTVTDYGQKFSWGGVNGYTNDQVSGSCHSKAFYWTDYELGDGGSTASNMTKYNSTDGKTVLEAVDDAAIVNMGAGWRMPTDTDFAALSAATTNSWVTDYQGSGINGRLFTDKTDSSKVLFFPAAGYCRENYNVVSENVNGKYWSNLYKNNVLFSNILNLHSSGCDMNSEYRYYGLSVRGVVDE